jgi:hypothetical protein
MSGAAADVFNGISDIAATQLGRKSFTRFFQRAHTEPLS